MPDETKKYPTYKALAEAFASGELDQKFYKLILDNDSCRLRYWDPADDDNPIEQSKEAKQKDEQCQDWFDGYGWDDLEAVVKELGVPCEMA